MTPYQYTYQNPVKYIDPKGMEGKGLLNEYDAEGNKISDLGGSKVDFFHQKNGDTKVVVNETGASTTISGGEKLIRGYKRRGYYTTVPVLVNEFITGTGIENSLFYGNTRMNRKLQKTHNFLRSYGDYLLTDMKEPTEISRGFGILGALREGTDLLGQFLGKTSFSFYPLGDRTLVVATDSKSFNSFNPFVKFSAWLYNDSEIGNYDRAPIGGKNVSNIMTNTRQTYMFFVE